LKLSPAMEEQYEENRLKMAEVNKRFRFYMWAQLVISILFFVFAMFAGASSTQNEDVHGPAKFYYAMDAGLIQILLAVASLVVGFLAAMRKRLASFVLLALYLFMLIYTLVGSHVQGVLGNCILFVGGLALNGWMQGVFGDLHELSEKPGFPHFSVLNEERGSYEAPIYVTHRQTADHMDTVGGSQTAAAPAAKKQSAMPHAGNAVSEDMFAEMTVPERRASAEAALPKPDIALDSFSETAQKSQEQAEAERKQAELERQHALEAAMLSDMTPENAHHYHEGDASMLPSAEEVRARMAAMKKARQNGQV